MKKVIIYNLLFIVAIGFISCDKWLNGQVIDLELPEHDPVLTAYLYLDAGVDVIDMRVGKTIHILADEQTYPIIPEVIDGVTVSLYRDGTFLQSWEPIVYNDTDSVIVWISPNGVDTFWDVESRFSYLSPPLNEPIVTTSASYTIEVSAPGFETISATQTVPTKPVVNVNLTKDIPVRTDYPWITYDSKGDKYDVTINDPAGEENVYAIRFKGEYIYQIDSTEEIRDTSYMYVINNENIFGYSVYGMTFTDQSFDGGQRTFSFEKWYEAYGGGEVEQRPNKVWVEVTALSNDYYTFDASLDDYYDAYYNPLAEPVVLFSNVENGLGLFALHNKTIIEIER